MKKVFKCPICGEDTIDIKEKNKLDYRYKSKLKCSNCNSRLRISKKVILLNFSSGLIGILIAIRNMDLIIKILLFILLAIIYSYLYTYIIPIVKDE